MTEIRPLPAAFVAQLDDGRLVVLHGQAYDMATSPDAEQEDVPWSLDPTYLVPPPRGYRTAVHWRQTFRADYLPHAHMQPDPIGVALYVDGTGEWTAVPLTARTVDELVRLHARVDELEATQQLRGVVDAAREAVDVADRMGDDFTADTIALHNLRDRIADLDRETS